jgi:hypothetical protein
MSDLLTVAYESKHFDTLHQAAAAFYQVNVLGELYHHNRADWSNAVFQMAWDLWLQAGKGDL